MPENMKARLAGMGLALLYGLAVVGGWWVLTGFEVWRLEWWLWIYRATVAQGHPPLEESAVMVGMLTVPALIWRWVPWRMDAGDYGRAAWARWSDLRLLRWSGMRLRWTRRPRGGIVLGRWRGRYLVMAGWRSVMLFGPTGAGKTLGLINATILTLGRRSVVVNDPAGDIFSDTAGARAELGPVYRIEWGADGGHGFNSLARSVLPQGSADRGTRCDVLAAVLLPETKGGNKFFSESGRSGLATFALYCVYAGEAQGVDVGWSDVLSTFSRLGAGGDGETDSVRDGLMALTTHARALAMPERVIDGLSRLADYDAKTRANITATMAASLRAFENEHVARTTSRCDFSPLDLRGVEPSGWRKRRKPVSVYLVVPPTKMGVFGPVTALFLETCYDMLSEKKPKGQALGTLFALDELYFIPPCELVKRGPAILRKYLVNFILGFQDRGQIEEAYGREALSAFDQNTAVKTLFVTNHVGTAEWVEKLIGKRTGSRRAISRQARVAGAEGLSVSGGNSTSQEGRSLVSAQDVLGLREGEQIVIVQGKAYRPVRCWAPIWLKYRPFKRCHRPAPELPTGHPEECARLVLPLAEIGTPAKSAKTGGKKRRKAVVGDKAAGDAGPPASPAPVPAVRS